MDFNTSITVGICKAETMTEEEKKNAVIDLIKQGKGNLYIVTQTGATYEEVRSIRRLHENAHSSCN